MIIKPNFPQIRLRKSVVGEGFWLEDSKFLICLFVFNDPNYISTPLNENITLSKDIFYYLEKKRVRFNFNKLTHRISISKLYINTEI